MCPREGVKITTLVTTTDASITDYYNYFFHNCCFMTDNYNHTYYNCCSIIDNYFCTYYNCCIITGNYYHTYYNCFIASGYDPFIYKSSYPSPTTQTAGCGRC